MHHLFPCSPARWPLGTPGLPPATKRFVTSPDRQVATLRADEDKMVVLTCPEESIQGTGTVGYDPVGLFRVPLCCRGGHPGIAMMEVTSCFWLSSPPQPFPALLSLPFLQAPGNLLIMSWHHFQAYHSVRPGSLKLPFGTW